MAVYKLQLKNKQFSILSTAWDKGKSIYKRLKGWLSKKPALIPKGAASDAIYNSTAAAAKNGAKKAGGYAEMAGQGANKSGGYLRGTQNEAVEAIRNRKQAAKNAAKGGNGGANNANNTKNSGNNGNVKNNQNQNQPKQGNNSKKPAVYKVGNGKGITFNKVRSNTPNMNGFTTTLSRNPYDLGGYSGFKYVYK